jgi:uncharacterized protein YndB with AHSA1/START domain
VPTYEASTSIAAPPQRVWQRLAAVTHWPDWLPTVTAVHALAENHLQPGARFRITQPRLRPAIWKVTHVQHGHGFTWETRSPGLHVVAEHLVVHTGPDTCRVVLRISFSGPLALLARWLAGALTQHYLQREAAALRYHAEKRTAAVRSPAAGH